MPAANQAPQRPKAEREIIGNPFFKLGKLKLDVRRLFRNPVFRQLNPELTPEILMGGQYPASKIRFPGAMPLTFELSPRCQPYPVGLRINKKERNLQSFGFPVFIEGRMEVTTALSAINDHLQKEKCIVQVTIDYVIDIRAKNAVVNHESRNLADYTLNNMLMRGEVPLYIVLGTYSDLVYRDPRFYEVNTASDQLVELEATYTTAANKPIKVTRRGLQLSDRYQGRVTKTNVALGIIRAVKNNANVIAFNLPQFEPADFESAIAFAKSKGAIVVNNVPVPTTTKQAHAQAKPFTTEIRKKFNEGISPNAGARGKGKGKGGANGAGKGAGKGGLGGKKNPFKNGG